MSVGSLSPCTPDDLLVMPDGENYEIVDGELRERSMSLESSWVAGEVLGRIREVVRPLSLGWAFPEGTGFQCFPDDPTQLRRADAAFIRREQLPLGPVGQGYCRIVPDLAVEVVSPNDLAWQVREKIDDWLAAGVSQLWVLWPGSRTVDVYSLAGVVSIGPEEELTAGELLPGFRCRVSDLFPPQPVAAAQ